MRPVDLHEKHGKEGLEFVKTHHANDPLAEIEFRDMVKRHLSETEYCAKENPKEDWGFILHFEQIVLKKAECLIADSQRNSASAEHV